MTNLLEVLSIDTSEVRDCFNCGAHAARVKLGENRVIWACAQCGAECEDGRSEIYNDRQNNEQRRNLLTPLEIRAIRKKYALTRKAFSALTGFAEKTIKRWETGAIVQSTSADRFLRLIRDDPRIVDNLRDIVDQSDN